MKEKEFVFETWEVCCVGDKYKYTVTATSKEEAFEKLVKYFFGKESDQPVRQEHFTIEYPQFNRSGYTGMPYWFSKRLGGWLFDWVYGWFGGKYKISYQEMLEEYARKHNIELQKEK